MTLCIVLKDERLLLGMKKRGFGAGKWNGFGGKLEPDETVEIAAAREIQEEVGIDPLKLEKMGRLDFEFQDGSPTLEVHIFKIENFVGTPEETEEMRPQWFEIGDIPYDEMWPDDRVWLPMLLLGMKFDGKFVFDKPSTPDYTSVIVSKEIAEVE